MLSSYKILISALLATVLVACVSVNNKLRLVSNAYAAQSDTPACESSTFKRVTDNNPQALNPENIAFLNWNIYKGNGENWQQDLSAFAQEHDVMTIQEAMLDDELTGLLATYDFNWVMNTAFYLNGTPAGVMTVATSDTLYSCGFKVDEPLLGIPKSVLVSYYSITGTDKELLVANIHGINFTLGVDAYRQQLEQLHNAIKHHDGPMIVAGDFNTWSDDRMAEVYQMVNRLSLSGLDYPVNHKTHVFGNAIDHVFYRQLQPIKNQVKQVDSSDHNPISVSFRHSPVI